jgi:hypothetical protein
MSATTLRRGYDQLTRPAPAATTTGEPGDAITMPATFGALVLAELEIMMLAGPVVADDEGSWTFLTQPANTRTPAVPADLLALGVRLVPADARPAAPASVAGAGSAPAIWAAVIGASRRVAERTRRSA